MMTKMNDEFKTGEFVDIVDGEVCNDGKPVQGFIVGKANGMSGMSPVYSKKVFYRVEVPGRSYSFLVPEDKLRKASL